MLTFFIGSYTQNLTPDFLGSGQGIYTVQLNTDNGELTTLHTQDSINPSYLVVSNDNRFLYCNTEVSIDDKPKVKSYRIHEDLSLEYVNDQAIAGGYPCHIEIHNNSIFVSSYETGNVLQFPLDEYKQLMACQNNIQHHGSSTNKNRQEAPHVHQVSIHPNGKDIYVCDLGIDTIKMYQLQGTKLIADEQKDITLSKGGGVRHMVFNKEGSMAYAINELTGDVSVLKNKDEKFEQISTVSSLPNEYKGEPSASAIRIHPNEKFLYAANRQLEAITIFSIKDDELEILDYQYTKGNELREFNISPDGKWLIACHQNSHDVVVYQIQNNGKLIEISRTKDILSPVCITFPK